MIARWIRLLMIVGILITSAVFIVALTLFTASILWQPQAQPQAGSTVNPFSAGPSPSASTTVAAGGGADTAAHIPPDIQRTAQLETIARALNTYRYASKAARYPASLDTVVQAGYLAAQPDPSYVYAPDQAGTFFSVCNMQSNTYECVSSDLGTDVPFVFPFAALDESRHDAWQRIGWNDGTSTSIQLVHPPGWSYQSDSATLELDATETNGATVTIAKVSLANYPLGSAQTLEQFQKSLIARSSAQVTGTQSVSIGGFPAYQSLVQNPMLHSQVFGGASLLIDPGNGHVYQLTFFSDRTLTPLTANILLDMLSSVQIVRSGS
jgi:hypothetical protein